MYWRVLDEVTKVYVQTFLVRNDREVYLHSNIIPIL